MGDNNDCKNCIQIENIKETLAEIKIIQQDHEKRVIKLERHNDANEERFKTLFNTIDEIKKDIISINAKLDMLINKPAAKLESRWEKAIEALIALAVGALFTYILKK